MSCETFESLIALHVEGDLTAAEAEELERHLRICAACRDFAEEMRASQWTLKEHGRAAIDPAVLAGIRAAYADVRDLAEILGLLDVAVRIDVEHQAIVLRGHDGELDTALKLIEELDEPPAPSLNIELTVFIVGASKEKSNAAALPSDLEAVVARLGDLFGYRDFELLDTIFLRVRDGSGAQVESFLNEENPYQFRFKRARIFGFNRATMQEDESILRFEDLFFHHLKESTDLQTGVEIREGQKAVIGKTTPGRDGQTLILVLEAKILEYYDE